MNWNLSFCYFILHSRCLFFFLRFLSFMSRFSLLYVLLKFFFFLFALLARTHAHTTLEGNYNTALYHTTSFVLISCLVVEVNILLLYTFSCFSGLVTVFSLRDETKKRKRKNVAVFQFSLCFSFSFINEFFFVFLSFLQKYCKRSF